MHFRVTFLRVLLDITFALNAFLFGEFIVHIKHWLTVEAIMEARNGNQAVYDIGELFLVPKHQGQQELHVHLKSFCTRYGESKQIVLLFLPEQK